MAFDRSQFKGTKVTTLTSQDEKFEKKTAFAKKGRAGFIKLGEGKNKLRVYPAHPKGGEEASFMYPCVTHWLDVESTYKDKEGKEITKLGRKPVFSAKAHSDIGACPIDLYILSVYRLAGRECQTADEKAKFTAPIKGRNGITGSTKWIAYASLGGEFGRIELGASIKNAMNDIAQGQDTENGVVVTDPFTDADTGRCVIITKDSQLSTPEAQREASKYYSTSIDLAKATPLSDEELMAFVEVDSLESLYNNVYTKRDFDMAVDGLRRFDAANSFKIFDDEEFTEALAKIYDKCPEPKEAPTKDSEPAVKKKAAAKAVVESEFEEAEEVVEEEVVQSDLPFDLDYNEMSMEQLEGVIKRNNLPVRITKRSTLEDIAEWVDEEMALLIKETAKKAETAEEVPATSSRRRGASGLSSIKDELNDK